MSDANKPLWLRSIEAAWTIEASIWGVAGIAGAVSYWMDGTDPRLSVYIDVVLHLHLLLLATGVIVLSIAIAVAIAGAAIDLCMLAMQPSLPTSPGEENPYQSPRS